MAVDNSIKVLVVEDSKITRKMEIKALKALGFNNIVEADDGEDAIAIFDEQNDIGLIISDWNMPNKNGYELLVWVRGNEPTAGIPFIMATARGEKKQTKMAEEAGVSNFITKPFGAAELEAIINDTFTDESEKKEETPAEERVRTTKSGKLLLKVAHIQITDHLILGVLKDMIETEKWVPKHFELETQCMPGWNPVQQALETGDVDAAFILAPIAMDLYGYGAPIKLTLFAHKNGSISVKKRQDVDNNLMNFFEGRTFYIPHILSIHHMLSNQFLREIGLKPGVAGDKDVDVFFEVVPPINMPEFIASNESAGGFTVAEPLGTKTIAAGNAELLFLSGEMWEYHPCCVVCMRDEIIEQYPEAVQEFTDLLVKSGQFINDRVDDAAKIAVDFLDPGKKLGLNIAVLKNVLKEPQGIKTDDLFPVKEDLGSIQDYMSDEMGVGQKIDLDDFVLSSFADEACRKANSSRRPSVVHDVANVVKRVAERAAEQTDAEKLTNLDREGKYLVFNLDNQEYGVDIGTVREIVQMMKIKPIPRTPDYIKGVMNLRDKVIPVIDLRLTLGIEEKEYDQNTCIIILEVGGYQGTYQMGAVVDSVNEVLNIKATDIEDTPSFGVDINADFILAMAKTDGKVKTLLNTNRIFGQQESEMIGSIV